MSYCRWDCPRCWHNSHSMALSPLSWEYDKPQHRTKRTDKRNEVCVKKPEKVSRSVSGPVVAEGCPLRTCPLTLEQLTATTYDDGSRRQTATLSIFVDEGQLKLALHDRTESRSIFLTGDTLTGLLDALEMELEDPLPDWRSWKTRKSQK